MNAPDQNLRFYAHGDSARARIVALWIRAAEHPTDCLCAEVCAPISQPTRSPIVNAGLAGTHGVDVAQGVALLISLKPYGQQVAIGHLRALNGLQGKLG
jgi:hypothetical protein